MHVHLPANQIKALESEVRLWQEKHASAQEEQIQAEEETAVLSKRLARSKFISQDNLLDSSGLESDVSSV